MDKLQKLLLTLEQKSIDDNERIITFIGSTPQLDRDKEVIPISEWNIDNYKKNPVILWAHNYSALPIGKSLDTWIDGNRLMFKVQFASKDTYEFADTVYKLYKEKYLNAVSVGFNGSWRYDENTKVGTYTNVELYELSAVPVPANPDALVYMRGIEDKTLKDIAKQCDEFCDTKKNNDNKQDDIIKSLQDENKNLTEKILKLENEIKELNKTDNEDKEILELINKYKSVSSHKDNTNDDLKSLINKFKNIKEN